MIEMRCQHCGEKANVQSFLTAAQQTCSRCGQLLMGALARGSRTVRPAGFGDDPLPAAVNYGPGSRAALWVGVVLGVAAGVGLVVALNHLGSVVRPQVRGAILGALTGVILAPVLALSSFFSMIILPFSLEGIFGDSMWSRLAKALHHRSPRHLFLPVLLYVVLPMTLCGWGGSRMRDPSIFAISAGVGAVVLGAILGGILGAFAGKPRPIEYPIPTRQDDKPSSEEQRWA